MLTLYYKIGCPYCKKVQSFAEENQITLEEKDIYSDPSLLEELINRGGKKQVPYLVDSEKGVEMYESGDIIEYLKENYVQ